MPEAVHPLGGQGPGPLLGGANCAHDSLFRGANLGLPFMEIRALNRGTTSASCLSLTHGASYIFTSFNITYDFQNLISDRRFPYFKAYFDFPFLKIIT